MMKIPNDSLGRYWVQGQWTEEPNREKGIFATLVSISEDGEILILGSAFVIFGNGPSAICLGAAHSFERVKRAERLRSAHGYFNVSPDFREQGHTYVSPDKMRACFVINGQPILCRIGQLNYVENFDVVTFLVLAPEGQSIFNSHVAINLTMPRAGDEIAVLVNDTQIENKFDGVATCSQRFEMRLGMVTEVVVGRSYLPGLSSYFRTTIPVTGGMSGAPVLIKPVVGQSMIVCGVVSTDDSPLSSFSSFLVSGNSAASMLWPAMGLGLTLSIPPDDARHVFLGDLLQKKILDNRSLGTMVCVRYSSEATQVHYLNDQTTPPTDILLSIRAHPNVGL